MSVIDFHAHILPEIDDGSKSLETTVKMLNCMSEQGVDYVIATPHFYATKDRIDDFIVRREEAWERVLKVQKELHSSPKILKGAEVAFFQGISDAERIQNLTIGDTNLLLLEMPFCEWRDSYMEEVYKLMEERGFQIVLAHLERYMGIKENKKKIEGLFELPFYVQINAESLMDWKRRGKLVKLFKNGKAHFLGSDCHGMNYRVPNLGKGRNILLKKAGQDVLDKMDSLGEKLILEGKGCRRS